MSYRQKIKAKVPADWLRLILILEGKTVTSWIINYINCMAQVWFTLLNTFPALKLVLDMSLTWDKQHYTPKNVWKCGNTTPKKKKTFQRGNVVGTVWGLLSNWRYHCEKFHYHLVHYTPETAVYTRLLCRVSTPLCVKRHFVNMRMTL